MNFIENDYKDYKIFQIYEDKLIGSIEMWDNFIEMIYLEKEYRGHRLKPIIEFLLTKYSILKCLPLPDHRIKFEKVGFHAYISNNDDMYYQRTN